MRPFSPEVQLAALNKHGVLYVLIGGLAATLRGSPLRTGDADVCPERTPENLDRLSAALRELHARIRTESVADGLPFACDRQFFAQVALANLVTDAGDLDVSFQPSGTQGYRDLAQNADVIDLGGLEVPVASLDDIIRSKTAANRPKDLAALPVLRELARQIAATKLKP